MTSYGTGWVRALCRSIDPSYFLRRRHPMITRQVPQHHRDITLGRLDSYLNKDMFSDANLVSKLYNRKDRSCISMEVYSVPKGES